MERATRERRPTLWGYARIAVGPEPSRAVGSRVDVLVPPVLTPGEMADLHGSLRPGVVRGRRDLVRGASPGRTVRRALDAAVEIRTTEALDRAGSGTAESPLVGSFVRLLLCGTTATLSLTDEALARGLAWSGASAAREGDAVAMIDAVLALDHLLGVSSPAAG